MRFLFANKNMQNNNSANTQFHFASLAADARPMAAPVVKPGASGSHTPML